MNKQNTQNCIGENEARIIALRMMSYYDKHVLLEYAKSDKIPDGIFNDSEKRLQDHIESCPACKKRILDEFYLLLRYCETLSRIEGDRAFRQRVEELVSEADSPASEKLYIELKYVPYKFDETHGAMAASTEPPTELPLRFMPEQGKPEIILTENRIPNTSTFEYHINSEHYDLDKYFVRIDGNTYSIDKDKMIISDDKPLKVTKDSKITVIPKSIYGIRQ